MLTIGLKPSPLNEFLVTCQQQATASDLPFYDIFAPQQIPLLKFMMMSLHVICGLPLPLNQKSWLRLGVTSTYFVSNHDIKQYVKTFFSKTSCLDF